jgi:hypothetical protein
MVGMEKKIPGNCSGVPRDYRGKVGDYDTVMPFRIEDTARTW